MLFNKLSVVCKCIFPSCLRLQRPSFQTLPTFMHFPCIGRKIYSNCLRFGIVIAQSVEALSVFTSDFGKIPVHLGKDKYLFHYVWENIHKIRENKTIFGLGMPPYSFGNFCKFSSYITVLCPFNLLILFKRCNTV